MTKEITKAYLLQQLEDKFKLREFEPEVFTFSERVVPTYNIGQDVRTRATKYYAASVTGTGGVLFFTVPYNERWFLKTYNVIFMGVNTCTIAGVYITRVYNPNNFIYLDLTAAQTVSYAVNLPKVIVLDSGDNINVNVDGYTSAQTLRLYIDYEKEEIR